MEQHELLELKDKIEEASEKASERKGQKKLLMKQLSDDWDCKTIDQAEKKVEKLEKESDDLNDKIKEGLKELEEKYQTDE